MTLVTFSKKLYSIETLGRLVHCSVVFSCSKTLDKKTKTDDQNNKLDKNESQPAVNKNKIEESCTIEHKQIATNSTGAQEVPCDIKGA